MAEENSSSSGIRLRLPKLWADKAPAVEANQPVKGATDEKKVDSTSEQETSISMATQPQSPGPGPITPTLLSQQISSQSSQIVDEIAALRSDVELLQHAFVELGNRESQQEKVFNVLHKELGEYKNDFIYEHLKPVIRPLLFLYDSLEQFEGEVEATLGETESTHTLTPQLVRDNVIHFRDQLVEALQVCEVTKMEQTDGEFDPKLHKAMQVVAVEQELDNIILRMVRSGWYLRGQVFRPAEVVVGRCQAR